MLVRFSFEREEYSHIILLPLVSTSLFVLERKRIFRHAETHWWAGSGLLVGGILLYWFGERQSSSGWTENNYLFISTCAAVVIWMGIFAFCYGTRAFRAGLFPLLFLLLMVPIPDFFLNRTIVWLQTWSAEVSFALFELVGVPVFRTGFVFSLPGVTIEIARECSGIRSSVVLLIISLLAGHLFLRSAWAKAVLTLATFPLVVVKNGIRIVALSLLSIYVDPSFLTGRLHHQGGVLFFLLGLVLLAPVLRLLQRLEAVTPPSPWARVEMARPDDRE